jgi:ABC-type methionine transport system permease subunit
MAESVPHVGAQAAPFAVNVHVTPALAESFATEAFTVTADVPDATDAMGSVMVTVIAALPVIVKESEALLVGSVTEVAVTFGALSGDPGSVAGGV